MDEKQRRYWLERLSMAKNAVMQAEEGIAQAAAKTDESSPERDVTRGLAALAQELRVNLESVLTEKGEQQG